MHFCIRVHPQNHMRCTRVNLVRHRVDGLLVVLLGVAPAVGQVCRDALNSFLSTTDCDTHGMLNVKIRHNFADEPPVDQTAVS